MATIHTTCYHLRLILLLSQVITTLTIAVYKEDCKLLENVVDLKSETISQITGIQISDKINSIPCGSLLQTTEAVCELVSKKEIASSVFYVTCDMARQLLPFFQSIGLKHEKHEFLPGCLGGPQEKATVRTNFYDAIEFMKDIMITLSGNSVVLITDMQPELIRRGLADHLRVARIVDPTHPFNLDKMNYRGIHFFVLCTASATRNVLRDAETSGLLSIAQSWIILTDINQEVLLQGIDIPYNTHVAVATTANNDAKVLPHHGALLWTPKDQQSISCSDMGKVQTSNPKTEVGEPSPPKALSLELYEVYSLKDNDPLIFKRFGSWFSMNNRLRLIYTFPNMLRRLDGVHLRVITIDAPPYITFKGKEETPETLEGFYGFLFKELAREMNFTFSIEIETVYGLKDKNNNWNGLFRKLQDNQADVALSSLSATRDRKEVADFSSKISSAYMRMVYKIPDEKYHFRLYIIPFGWEIWLLVTASIVVSGILLYISNRISPQSALHSTSDPVQLIKVKHQFSLLDCFLAVYNGFNQQGSELEPREVSGKIIFITIYLSFVIVFSSYTSVFTSFLTISDTKKLFDTLEDVYRDKNYKIGLIGNTNYEDIFKDETDDKSINYKVWQRISADKKNLVSDVPGGLDRAFTEKYVFLTPKESTTYYLGNNCSFDMSNEDLFSGSIHFAYAKNFTYAETFNEYINRMVESGVIARLGSKYQRDQINFCSTDSVKPLGFKKVVSLYLLLAGASLFAAAALGVEWLFRVTGRSKNQASFGEQNRNQNMKPLSFPGQSEKPLSYPSQSGKPLSYPNQTGHGLAYKSYYFS